MRKKKIALLGFGTVGASVYHLLTTDESLSKRIKVVLILVKDKEKKRPEEVQNLITTDPETVFKKRVDIMMEMIGGDEPAYTLIKRALMRKITVITSNKVVAKNHFFELSALAAKQGVGFLYEASTVSGVPVIHGMQDMVQTDPVKEIRGILNASTNFCLTQAIADKTPFEETKAAARERGYLEADPNEDFAGFDSLRKLLILSFLAYQVQIPEESCTRMPLTNCTDPFLEYAGKKNLVLKYVATSKRQKTGYFLSVEPVLYPKEHLFASVANEYNIIQVDFEHRGLITWIGRGAGGNVPAEGMLSDLLDVLEERYFQLPQMTVQTLFSHPDDALERYLIQSEEKIDPTIIERKSAPFYTTIPIKRETLSDLMPKLQFYARIEKPL